MLLRMMLWHSFLWLSNIPSCIYVHRDTCMSYMVQSCPLYSDAGGQGEAGACPGHLTQRRQRPEALCVFFIRSSVVGCLGYFHVLAIVISAAMNVREHISFSVRVFSRYLLGNEIAGPHASPVFSFLRNLCTVLHVAVLVCIPTNNVRRFPFLHTLPSIYCL